MSETAPNPARTRLIQEWAQPFLILLALLFAYCLPFEGFFLSYAVLGPLHYLTQLSWLHDRQYFINETAPRNGFVALTLVLAAWASIPYEHAPDYLPSTYGLAFVVLSLLLLPILLSMPVRGAKKVLLMMLSPLAAWAVLHADFFVILGAFLIPTLCHVALFTFTFLLLGARRTKSLASIVTAICWLLAAGLMYFMPPALRLHDLDWFNTHHLFFDTKAFALGGNTEPISQSWTVVYAFLTFAYTYHYLNWFSKTELLKWHKIPAERGLAIIAFYIASIVLFVYDYVIGLKVQLFLNLLHVFLEFPLNIQTFRALLSWKSPVRPTPPPPTDNSA